MAASNTDNGGCAFAVTITALNTLASGSLREQLLEWSNDWSNGEIIAAGFFGPAVTTTISGEPNHKSIHYWCVANLELAPIDAASRPLAGDRPVAEDASDVRVLSDVSGTSTVANVGPETGRSTKAVTW